MSEREREREREREAQLIEHENEEEEGGGGEEGRCYSLKPHFTDDSDGPLAN